MATQIIADSLQTMIESYIVNTLREAHPDIDVAPGSVMYDLFVAPSVSILEPLIETINENELAMDFVNYGYLSDSEDNDVVGEKGTNNYFITRREGTKATGSVAFQVTEIPRNTKFIVPQGTLVSTDAGINFRTTSTFEITSSEAASLYNYSTFMYDIPVVVEADQIGTIGNIEAKEITTINTPFNSRVASVTNYTSFSGGTDREETTAYLERIRDFYTNNFIGTEDGYRNLILDNRQEVEDMYIAGFRDKYMHRDKGRYTSQDGTEYEGHIGGKVDIYLKGTTTGNYTEEVTVTNGRKKLAYKNLIPITEWSNNYTLLTYAEKKDIIDDLITQADNSISDEEKGAIYSQMYTHNIPHTFHTYPERLYTWIKFADNNTGLNMSDSPVDKSYIGIAIEKESSTKSEDMEDYSWAKINEENGVQMPTDSNGRVYYMWIKYADDVYGTNMNNVRDNRKYVGFAFGKTSPNKTDDYEDYTWYLLTDEALNSGLITTNTKVEYHYINVKDEDLTINEGGEIAREENDLIVYYFYDSKNLIALDDYEYTGTGKVLNSEAFTVSPIGYILTGPIVNPMISLTNTTSGEVYDVLNSPNDFYSLVRNTPACPEEDKLTYQGTVLETLIVSLVKEKLGFNGDTVIHTYTKNETIATLDDVINEKDNRIITTDVLLRPAGVKYVNIKIEIKPEDGVLLTDELDDRITKVIGDRIDSLELGASLDESDLISDLYAGDYAVRDMVEYIKLPFLSIYPVTEEQLNDPIIDGKRGDFSRDLNGYDVPTQFVKNQLPITTSPLQHIKLNKLQLVEISY